MTMDIMFAVAILSATFIYSVCFHCKYKENKPEYDVPRFYATVPPEDTQDVIIEPVDMRI